MQSAAMKIYLQFLVVLPILFGYGCAKKGGTDVKLISLRPTDLPIMLSSVVSRATYVKLETSDSCMVGNVDKMLYYDRRFYLLDTRATKSLFVFNDSGSFLFKISRQGGGPGEYSGPDDFCLDTVNGHVVIVDRSRRKIIEYQLQDGKFYRELFVMYFPYCITATGEEHFAFYTGFVPSGSAKGGVDHSLLVTNRNYEVKRAYFPFDIAHLPPRIAPQTVFASAFGGAEFLPVFGDTVYRVEGTTLTSRYVMDFADKSIPRSFFQNRDTPEKERELLENYCFLRQNYCETGSHVYFTFRYKGFAYSAFYNKTTGTAKVGRAIANDIDGMPFGQPMCVSENRLVGIIEPFQILEQMKTANGWHGQNPTSTFLNLTDLANPVLVFYTLVER